MQHSNPIKEQIQQDALNKFVEHFYKNKNIRGTLCACCGYGKSYLIYKILKECVNKGERLFIIATSRIKLLEQLGPDIENWNKHENNKINLQVSILCSDDIYKNSTRNINNKLNIDEKQIIEKITKRKENTANIFLTTYNSAIKLVDKISEFNKKQEESDDSNVIDCEPDLIILDEAHNTVGSGKKLNNQKYHHELFKHNDYFNASKYLFMTATPIILKHKNPNSLINTEEIIYSMDNKDIYGELFYYYSFALGIKEKIITNFQTIYLEQNKEFLEKTNNKDNFNKDRLSVLKLSREEQQQLYFRDISHLLIESMIKYKFNKTIIYIGNKEKAEIFKNILEKIKEKQDFEIYKIVSDSPTSFRRSEEDKFIKSNKGVLIAVNIYNEGIDIPCIDSVMFAEERNSSTTIVQNIGRCLRLNNNKPNKIGYVIVPNILYKFAGDENNEFFASTFKNIRKCINIIKNKTDKHFFEKYTDNTKNIDDEQDIIDNDDEQDIIDDKNELNDININNVCIEITEKDKHQIELLKYFNINATYDGFISNRTLEDIRNKYIVDKKCNDIKEYGRHLRKNYEDHILRTDIEYKNEWISWDYYFNNNTVTYKDCKKYIKELQIYVKINNICEFFDIYDYFINSELELENDLSDSHYKLEQYSKLIKLNSTNKIEYKKLLNHILKIPYQPKKFFTSSNEWISKEDFLNLNAINININNSLGSKESNEVDKNIKNILNNDDLKIKKGRYLYLTNINIPISIISYLKNKNLLNDKFKLCLRTRLTKNTDLYESGEILIMDIINENIFGKIILNERKLEYDQNLLLNFNCQKDTINLNNKLYLDKTCDVDINDLIKKIKEDIIKDKVIIDANNSNIKLNEELKIDNDLIIRKKNNIIIEEDDNFKDDELEKYLEKNLEKSEERIKNKIKNKMKEIEMLIKERATTTDNYTKNVLLMKIQKIYPNYGKPWTFQDKNKLIKNLEYNIELYDLISEFGRNEGGIISQIKTMLKDNVIDKNILSDDIYNKVYPN
jgi:superfamily II DNA or RNA helicase